jgi:ribosomal protein S18 acetylase RimI-like enzyme
MEDHMGNKTIRLATETDAMELSRLNQAFNGGEKVNPDKIRDSIRDNDELIVVATLDDRLVGFACAQSVQSFCYANGHGEITEMYVEENARRMGIASLMIALLEKKLVERGVTSIRILTGKSNKAAIHTYLCSDYIMEDEVVLEKKKLGNV